MSWLEKGMRKTVASVVTLLGPVGWGSQSGDREARAAIERTWGRGRGTKWGCIYIRFLRCAAWKIALKAAAV